MSLQIALLLFLTAGAPQVENSTSSSTTVQETRPLRSSPALKEGTREIGAVAQKLLLLRPVTFTYPDGNSANGRKSYGLLPEEVAKVFPEMVDLDDAGQPRAVRYHLLTPLLLSEFQRLYGRLEALEAAIYGAPEGELDPLVRIKIDE